jgi:hypothetical protein
MLLTKKAGDLHTYTPTINSKGDIGLLWYQNDLTFVQTFDKNANPYFETDGSSSIARDGGISFVGDVNICYATGEWQQYYNIFGRVLGQYPLFDRSSFHHPIAIAPSFNQRTYVCATTNHYTNPPFDEHHIRAIITNQAGERTTNEIIRIFSSLNQQHDSYVQAVFAPNGTIMLCWQEYITQSNKRIFYQTFNDKLEATSPLRNILLVTSSESDYFPQVTTTPDNCFVLAIKGIRQL